MKTKKKGIYFSKGMKLNVLFFNFKEKHQCGSKLLVGSLYIGV